MGSVRLEEDESSYGSVGSGGLDCVREEEESQNLHDGEFCSGVSFVVACLEESFLKLLEESFAPEVTLSLGEVQGSTTGMGPVTQGHDSGTRLLPSIKTA